MIKQPILDNLDDWQRAGRGRVLQFFATDEEVQRWLIAALPSEYAPYLLIGVDLVKEGRIFVEKPFQCEVSSLLDCMQLGIEPRFKFWIWSKVLIPNPPLKTERQLSRWLSFNGLVLLQHGRTITDKTDPSRQVCRSASSIGMVDKVVNIRTGETRQFEGYLKIYKKIHKAISKSLMYSSIVRFRDGHEEEDTQLQLMTEGAVQSYNKGFPFINKPGRLLKTKI